MRRRIRLLLSWALMAPFAVASFGAAVPAGAQGAVTPVTTVPRPDHVVIVVEENHSDESIIGNAAAPYLNSLAAGGANLSQFFAETHPSQPNYLALFSGSTQGITDDSCPHTFTTDNLGSQLAAAGLGFVGYSEGLPAPGATDCVSGRYARKHAPWVNFSNVAATASQPFSAFPSDYSTLPAVSIVIPDLDNDMHDGTIAQADQWLQANLGGYVTWAQTHNSVFALTFDEDDQSQGNQIATVVTGQQVVPGTYPETLNHYNLLRTIQDAYGLPAVGASALAAPILDIWTGGGPPADPAPYAADTFNRTVSSGLGAADTGGSWQLNAAKTSFAVAPGAATWRLAAANAYVGAYLGAARSDADVRADLALDRLPVGGPVQLALFGRRVSAGNGYAAKVYVNPGGGVTIRLVKQVGNAESALAGPVTVGGLIATPGHPLRVRVQVTGTAPTTLRARVWDPAGTEPASWPVSASDATTALQAAGVGGLTAYAASTVSNAPLALALSSYSARPTAPPAPPANQPPVAGFAATCTARACSFDAAASTDGDGTVVGWQWAFGDGATASGPTVQHTYAADGSYPVTLTVTDNQGATGALTRSVTVASTMPAFASDSFGRTVANGWGIAEVGGKWTLAGDATRAAVTPGAASFRLDPGVSMTGYLGSTARSDTDLTVAVGADRLPVGGALDLSVTPRRVSSGNGYRTRVLVNANATVSIRLIRSVGGVETIVAGPVTVPGLTYTPGLVLSVRSQAVGTAPTTLRAAVWPSSQAQPAVWPVSASDATAGLQTAGTVGVVDYLAPAGTVPVTVTLRSLVARPS